MGKDLHKYELIDVSLLKPYEKNARTHSPEQVEGIIKSFNEFGFINPVIIDEKKNIIAGHGRLEAAKKMGLDEVPCLIVEGLTEEQRKAYVIADNRLAEQAGWDMVILQQELQDLVDVGFDIELTGFDMDFLEVEMEEAKEDDFDAPLPEEPKAKLGDIYQLGRHKLMCGDSTLIDNVESLMGGAESGYAVD